MSVTHIGQAPSLQAIRLADAARALLAQSDAVLEDMIVALSDPSLPLRNMLARTLDMVPPSERTWRMTVRLLGAVS